MKIIFIFIALLGFFIAFIGFHALMSFTHSVQSKTDVTVVGVGTRRMPRYSIVEIRVLEPNSKDTLVFTQNTPAKVGESVSIWNTAEMWIIPFWLRAENDEPPSREVFTGWLRHDSGLGIFFFLMGSSLMLVSMLSIIASKK